MFSFLKKKSTKEVVEGSDEYQGNIPFDNKSNKDNKIADDSNQAFENSGIIENNENISQSTHNSRSSINPKRENSFNQLFRKTKKSSSLTSSKEGSQKSLNSLPSDLGEPPTSLDDDTRSVVKSTDGSVQKSIAESIPDSLLQSSVPEDPPPDESSDDEFPIGNDDGIISISVEPVTGNEIVHDDKSYENSRPFESPRSSRPPPTLQHTTSSLLQNIRGNLKKTKELPVEECDNTQEEIISKQMPAARSLIRGQSLLTPVPAKVRGYMRPSVAMICDQNEGKRLIIPQNTSLLGTQNISRAPSNNELNAGLDGMRTLNLPIHKRKLSMSAVKTRQAVGAGKFRWSSNLRSTQSKDSINEEDEKGMMTMPRKSNTKFLFSLGEEDEGTDIDHQRESTTLLPFQSECGDTEMVEPNAFQGHTMTESTSRPSRHAFRQSGEIALGNGLDRSDQDRLKQIAEKSCEQQQQYQQYEQHNLDQNAFDDDVSLISSLSGGSSMFLPKPSRSKSVTKEKNDKGKSSILDTQLEGVNEEDFSQSFVENLSEKENIKTKDKTLNKKKKKKAGQSAKEIEERERAYQKALQEEHQRWLIPPKKHPNESILMRLFKYVEKDEEDKMSSSKKKKFQTRKGPVPISDKRQDDTSNCSASFANGSATKIPAEVSKSTDIEERRIDIGDEGENECSDNNDDDDDDGDIVLDVAEGTFGAELLQLISETQQENKKKKLTIEEKLQANSDGNSKDVLLDEEDYMQLMADLVDRDEGLDEGLEYWELKHAGLGDIIYNSITSVQSTAKMLHKTKPNDNNNATDDDDNDGKEKIQNIENKKSMLSRTVSSLTTSLAPLKMGAAEKTKSDEEEGDKFQALMEERRQKYLQQKKTPKLARSHSLFMEEGSDLDESDEDDVPTKTKHPFSLASESSSHTVGDKSVKLKKGVRDIANMTEEEIKEMLDDLADDSSLVSVPELSAHISSKKSQKKPNSHGANQAKINHPSRKQRFKDLMWGRAAEHMIATSKNIDPLMKIMREEAKLIGTEMMEEQFGERYSRKSKWEAVEHIRHLERRKIKQDKALEKAAALL